jgi:hypothetical protein
MRRPPERRPTRLLSGDHLHHGLLRQFASISTMKSRTVRCRWIFKSNNVCARIQLAVDHFDKGGGVTVGCDRTRRNTRLGVRNSDCSGFREYRRPHALTQSARGKGKAKRKKGTARRAVLGSNTAAKPVH